MRVPLCLGFLVLSFLASNAQTRVPSTSPTKQASGTSTEATGTQGRTAQTPDATNFSPASATSNVQVPTIDNLQTSAAASATSADSLNATRKQLVIGPGDLVSISVFGLTDFNADSRVDSKGEISLPLLNSVHVAGLTSAEAEKLLEKRFIEGGFLKNPHVSVLVKEFATQGVSILGEVVKPGVYPVLGPRRVLDLLSMAGGLSERAGKQVTIIRRDRPQEPITVSLTKDPSKTAESNVEIFPGDTVVVARAGVVYVVGDVGHPSGFTMDNSENLTVLQALALAEGAKPTASLDKAKILRKTPTGVHEIPIPLKKIMAAKSADISLQAEDVIFVPGSLGKSAARRTAEAIVSITTGLAVYRR